MCARASCQNVASVADFLGATERLGIVPDQAQKVVEQLFERHHAALTQVDESLVEAVTHCAPAVLTNEHWRVQSPALIHGSQPIQHAQDTSQHGRQRHCVLEPRADVHDACFQCRVTSARPEVPPDARRVLDKPGVHEDVYVALVLGVTSKSLRQACAWQRVEHGQAIAFKTRVAALPERR